MPYKTKQLASRLSRKTITAAAIVLLLLVSGMFFALNKINASSAFDIAAKGAGPATYQNEPGKQKLNLEGPTATERQQSEDNKDELVKQIKAESTPASSGKQSVKPQIVDAGQYEQSVEVRSFIPGLTESGGTCTATFSQGDTIFTRSTSSLTDAKTTQCARFIVSRNDFTTPGRWFVNVNYSSKTA